MPKRYNHIKLPEALFGRAINHTPSGPNPFPQEIPQFPDKNAYKRRLKSEIDRLNHHEQKVLRARRIDSDKGMVDLKLKFRGTVNKALVSKYNVSIYMKYDDTPDGQEYPCEVILGKISNQKLPRQNYSNFEQLSLDLRQYVTNDDGRSKFSLIEELSPLTLEEITNPELLDELSANKSQCEYIDVIFGDDEKTVGQKFNDLKAWLGDSYIAGVNTELVHYCRLLLNKESLEKVVASYSGIIGIDRPIKIVLTSGTEKPIDPSCKVNVIATNKQPILVLDHPVNTVHPLISPATETQIGDAYKDGCESHGTQVGSLIIYGTHLSSSGTLTAENIIKPVNIFPIKNGQAILDESILIDAVKNNYMPNRVQIANFSVNAYFYYDRKVVHRLTVLFDELSVKYNCIFIVSTGNLFTNWPNQLTHDFINKIGYPSYFDQPITSILPPSDGLNPIAVGSITYQASPNSIAGPREPSPISRRGFAKTKGFHLVKPDLVHYDSNFDGSFISEDNGPFMAHPNGGLVRAPGTSFAAPLVAHDLGVLSQKYPEYTANSLKALLIHFTQPVTSTAITNPVTLKALIGHGVPDIERALESLSTSASMVIEDSIKINSRKRIRIPVPAVLAGSSRKRLRLRKTLVYNPKVNPVSPSLYNPIIITARIMRSDERLVDNGTTQSYLDGAHKKSNVKAYPCIEKNTKDFTGAFWEVEVTAEGVNDTVNSDMIQDYSIVVTVEDMMQDEEANIYEDIAQMINIEVGVTVEAS